MWILVFYAVLMTEGRLVGGGPATAEFADQRSCQMAISEINRGWRSRDGLVQVQGGICVPKEAGR